MKKKQISQTGLLRPFSMETELDFIKRFTHNVEIRELFPNPIERHKMAETQFLAKWEEAAVTVTKLDGTRFFID